MKRSAFFAGLVTAVSLSACLQPTMELLQAKDGGSDAGGGVVGGGTAGGGSTLGGGSAVGGGNTGGGSAVDAGIPFPGPLAPALCAEINPGHSFHCPVDAGSCLHRFVPNGVPKLITEEDSATPVLALQNGLLFRTEVQGPLNTASLWFSDGTQAGSQLLRDTPAIAGRSDYRQIAESDTMVWAVEHSVPYDTNGSPVRRVISMVKGASSLASATVIAEGVPAPTSNGVVFGLGDYAFGASTNLYVFSARAGSGGQYAQGDVAGLGSPQEITAIAEAGNTTSLIYLQCAPMTGHCALRQFETGSKSTSMLIPDLDVGTSSWGGASLGGVVIAHNRVFVLTRNAIIEYHWSGYSFTTMKIGTFVEAPGWDGLSRFKLVDGKLRFGASCDQDADAPTFGTVEVDPLAGTSRWLNADPQYPYVGGWIAPAAQYGDVLAVNAQGLYATSQQP